MGFWKTVDEYLIFKEISRKDLSNSTGIKVQTINRAIQRDSEPTLIDGLKICHYLNLNPEQIIDLPLRIQSDSSITSEEKGQLHLYRKYNKLIQYCEQLSESQQNAICQLAKNLADS